MECAAFTAGALLALVCIIVLESEEMNIQGA